MVISSRFSVGKHCWSSLYERQGGIKIYGIFQENSHSSWDLGTPLRTVITVAAIKTSRLYEIKGIHGQSSSCRQTQVCVSEFQELYSFSAKGQTVPGTKKCYSTSCCQQCNPEDQAPGNWWLHDDRHTTTQHKNYTLVRLSEVPEPQPGPMTKRLKHKDIW